MTEATLLAFERSAQRLEWAVVYAPKHATATAVIKQRVHCFLKHSLFVAHDHLWCTQLHKLLQAVVAIDDAAIEIVKVRRGETSPIERHERS